MTEKGELMSTPTETSDRQLLDLLGQGRAMSVSEMIRATGVTATAVRQRLNRLLGQRLIQRNISRRARKAESSVFADRQRAPRDRLELCRLGDGVVG